jgi:hypothetical protein
MKKSLLAIGVVLSMSVSSIFAQSTDGPQAGQIGITVNVSPLLGQIFNGNPTINLYPVGISGKYYLSSTEGIRVSLGLQYGSETTTVYTADATTGNPTDNESGNQTLKNGNQFIIGLGYEMRKAAGKVQVSFGPQIAYSYTSGLTRITEYTDPAAANGDELEFYGGSINTIAVGGFIGIEYFVSSNFSIGTEFDISGTYSSTGRGLTKTQGQPDVKSATDKSNLGFGINNVGQVLVSVYF